MRRRKFVAGCPTAADAGFRLVGLTPWKSGRAGDFDFAATLSAGKLRGRVSGHRPTRRPGGRGPAVAQGAPSREMPSLEPPQEKGGAQVETEAEGRPLNESLIAPSFGGGPGGCSHRWGAEVLGILRIIKGKRGRRFARARRGCCPEGLGQPLDDLMCLLQVRFFVTVSRNEARAPVRPPRGPVATIPAVFGQRRLSMRRRTCQQYSNFC